MAKGNSTMQKPTRWLGGLLMIGVLTAACGSASTNPATSTPPIATVSVTTGQQDTATENGLAGLPLNSDGYMDISAEQLAQMLEQKSFTLVNVHIPYTGELPDTDIMIPFDQITEHLAELPAKDAPIVLYCRSGSMSTQAAKDLVALGYTNIFELDGGFNGWQAAGHPLLNK